MAEVLHDPGAMTPEQMRDEVWFWRENAGAQLLELQVRLKLIEERGSRGVVRMRKRIASLAELLSAALSGDVHATCFACGLPIRDGDACISDVEEGEMHAQCPLDGVNRGIRPGDKVFVEPESIVWEGDGPKPDHLVAHAHSRLFTTPELVERVDAAKAAIAGRRQV